MPTSQFSVADRTAVVTGGSSGIGRTIAERFVADGANVVICSREQARVDSVADDLPDDTAGAIHPVECDVRDREAVDALVDAAVEAFGGVDVLVNNAGTNFASEFDDISPNGWETILDINLTGTVNCLQAVGAEMRAGGGGAVVNLSSFVTHFPSPRQSHYGAAKAAVSHLTGTVAYEWADDDIRVNAVAPGVVLTPGVEHVLDRDVSDVPDRGTVDRQVGYPEEIADLVQFLVSPAASYVTGEVVDIRGVPQSLNLDDRFP
ncbi:MULTISPECIES: SDR family NAD(P)-dependent oxidoreductase [Salinibaculum]|uniref:SDR family NAD(P)-dependent oxidoreductase n=1 Tax=Salinibaculum TaxID=2732368 RepID=UPI0030D12302